MKFSSKMILAGLASAMAVTSASGFVATFPAGTFAPGMPGDVGAQIAGKDGWELEGDSLYDPSDARGLSYSNFLNSSLGAQLGGNYFVPDPDANVYLYHAVSSQLQYTTFSVDFAIQSSNEFNPGRDAFGFSFRDSGGGNLLTISLVPYTSPTYPANDAYQVKYTVGASPEVDALDTNGFPMFMFHNGLYSLGLGFTPNGANPSFSATLTGSNAQTFSGVATGLGSSTIGRVGMEWNLVGDGANNGIIVDNISLVPEASTSAVICLAGLALSFRRRRV